MAVRYYKVISADNKSCNGGDFDWEDYLPKDGEPGKWTPEIRDVAACRKGYHVTEYWNMWYEAGCRMFECEAGGVVVAAAPASGIAGVVDKAVCTSIRLCKEIIPQFDSDGNTGDCNIGYRNEGHYNMGHYNIGYRNVGEHNTGNSNIGHCNMGHFNTGNRNIGDCNTGDSNVGDCNIGNSNMGDYNAGDCNIGTSNMGDYNIGNSNMGYRNAGDYNRGHFNTGDYNRGHFNTGSCSAGFFNIIDYTINVFNKPCKIDVWEQAHMPSFMYFDIVDTMKGSWRKAYDVASEEDKLLLVKLPNFDADVFYEISGILVDPYTGKEKK